MDTFHTTYRELSEDEKAQINAIKTEATSLLRMFSLNDKNGREMAIAKTKLEEVVMWAVKAITK